MDSRCYSSSSIDGSAQSIRRAITARRRSGLHDPLRLSGRRERHCDASPRSTPSRCLTGPALVAEVGGELWAAVSLGGEPRAIADPFRPTAELVALLRERAKRLTQHPARPLRGDARGDGDGGRPMTALLVSLRVDGLPVRRPCGCSRWRACAPATVPATQRSRVSGLTAADIGVRFTVHNPGRHRPCCSARHCGVAGCAPGLKAATTSARLVAPRTTNCCPDGTRSSASFPQEKPKG